MKGLLAVLILSSALYAQTPSVAAGGVLNGASFDRNMPVTLALNVVDQAGRCVFRARVELAWTREESFVAIPL